EAIIAILGVAPAQTPDAARAAAEDVGGLEPGELPTQGFQDDLLNLHGALHGADGVGHGHLLGDPFSPGARWARSFHGALGSGQITYPRHLAKAPLTRCGRGLTLRAAPRRPAPPPETTRAWRTSVKLPVKMTINGQTTSHEVEP